MIRENSDAAPDFEYETYQEDTLAGHVKAGDMINGDNTYHTVKGNKVGTKWSEIRDTEGKLIFRVPNYTPITVTRRKPTQASRDADALWDKNRRVKRELDSIGENPENPAAARMRKVLDSEYNYLDYSDVGFMLDSQAEWRIQREFYSAYEYTRDRPADEWDGDYVDFVTEFCDSLTERLITKTRYAANRSTNQISNLMADLEIQALSKFIDDSKWWRF